MTLSSADTEIFYTSQSSPWGAIRLFSDGHSLIRLDLPGARSPLRLSKSMIQRDDLAIFQTARRELTAYLAGTLRQFTVPFDCLGTAFQTKVWLNLAKIPYGKTISYSELAIRIGDAKAVRAVAMANARNPLPIIIPCHRVIGKNGALTGYSGGGVNRKAALLKLEGITF